MYNKYAVRVNALKVTIKILLASKICGSKNNTQT